MTRKDLLAKVVEQYLESGDFNGYRVTPDLDAGLIRTLISDGDLELHCEDRHPNPSIRALPAEPIGEQLDKVHRVDGCLYPTPKLLRKQHVSSDSERPFTTMLAQGAAQLEFRAFDLSVLEFYRNDPRYHYTTDDIHGTIPGLFVATPTGPPEGGDGTGFGHRQRVVTSGRPVGCPHPRVAAWLNGQLT